MNLFIKLANKSGWIYKKTQKFDEKCFIGNDGDEHDIKCKIFLEKKEEYKYFPYIDTFMFYNTKEQYLTNDMDEYNNNKYIVKLRATDGREQGNEHFVYDIYNDDIIRVEESVYCDIGDARVRITDVIRMSEKSKVYALPSEVRYSMFDKRLYPKRSVVWSVYHDTFINKKESIDVFVDKDLKMSDIFHMSLGGKLFNFVRNKDSFVLNEFIKKGIDDNFYLKHEYNEEEVKKMKKVEKLETLSDYNRFFDEFLVCFKSKIDRKKNPWEEDEKEYKSSGSYRISAPGTSRTGSG